jgi:predicted NBD/HSP70 family sugar kinase
MGALGSNSKLVRIHNRALVLRIIQQSAPISRKEISKKTGLTPAAITKITNDLIGGELIVEEEKTLPNQGFGRKPIGLSINREKYRVISLFAGRTVIQAAICDLSGRILKKIEEYRNVFTAFSPSLEREVIDCLHHLLDGSGIDKSELLGIAISAPGPINAKRGIIHNTSNISIKTTEAPFDWQNVSLAEIVGKRFGLPVFTDNEANVAALGESWFGAGVGIDNFVLYSVGIGIGSGVIIDGMLYRGEDDVVSEIGHITIDYKGPKCICGNVGCLELYGGFLRLVEYYQKFGPEGGITFSVEDYSSVVRAIETIFTRASEGDHVANAAVEEIGNFLGIGAVSLANIFSPECIIVSGNDTGNADLSILIPSLNESVRRGAFSVIANKVKVLYSSLGNDARIYGGVALVLQDFFSQPGNETEFTGADRS